MCVYCILTVPYKYNTISPEISVVLVFDVALIFFRRTGPQQLHLIITPPADKSACIDVLVDPPKERAYIAFN